MICCLGSIQEVSQHVGESCKSGAVITIGGLLMDLTIPYFSPVQYGFGATNVAINKLFVQGYQSRNFLGSLLKKLVRASVPKQ